MGYETIASLAAAFGIKSSTPVCPQMQNWTISGMPNKNKLEDIFAGEGFEVVGVMVLNVHEMPLIATVHHAGGRKTSDITLIVEDKLDVDVDTDRVHSVSAKPGAKTKDAVRIRLMHTVDILYHLHILLLSKLSSMDSRLSSMDSRQSSMDSRLSFMDSRLSSMESKLDCLIKLFSSAYNTTEVQVGFLQLDKENYNFGEEMLEFLNGKESMMNIKPYTTYDRVNIGIVQIIGEFLIIGRELNFTVDDIIQFRKKYAQEIYAKELSV
ncbi:hypothetical protein FNV43_RR00712 [Rhamnella rubrinervis]|uniref:Uncharacterized protein n=1 Tax=Rhamnella rubrinervis TaxID=2594499 RepID=A0A8K0HPN9_9ROSA|nr:hypothetical protein FNV43_RR00712 [Rhamnella rubrinervis]